MCGICCCLFLISGNSRRLNKIIEDSILPHLQRRGPDHVGKKEYFAEKVQGKLHLTLVGTVLHLRGDKTPQPLEDEHGNVLLWNGEIFGGIQVEETENDSLVLLKALGSCPLELSPSQHVLSTMAKVQGPWAFVYWQASEQKLWFGRDYFGRRSLLWHLPSNSEDIFTITSVAERNSTMHHGNLTMEEIPADGLYCVDVSNDGVNERPDQPFRIDKYEWRTAEDISNSDPTLFLTCPVTPFNRQMPSQQDLPLIHENRRRLCLQKNETTNAHAQDVNITTEQCEKSMEKGKSLDEGGESVSEMGALCSDGFESLQEGIKTGTSALCGEDVESLQERNKTGNSTLFQSDLERTGSKHSFAACNSLQDEAFSSSSDITPPVLPRSENDETLTLELTATDSQVNEQSGCRELSTSLEFTPTSSCSKIAFCESVENSELSKHVDKIDSSGSIPQESAESDSLTTQWSSVYRTSQDAFISALGEAVRKRVVNLPRSENNSHSEFSSRDTCPVSLTNDTASVAQNFSALTVKKKDARVGILFSGGIDSMMIAALADRFVPSEEAIDLINVAFEQKPQTTNLQNKKKGKSKGKQSRTEGSSSVERERDFNVPDRVTGIAGLRELQSINPLRQWNFIEVDGTIEELQEMRSRHISHLVSPLNTVLDDSIGCALWFAARGRGCLRSSAISGGVGEVVNANVEDKAYTSTAKVLLVGMGADEQLGGYARHRTRFNNEGWSGLMQEMEMEVRRISKRNLGRDDRCISDHGREARFPFLDEEVVSFLNSLPVWVKTDPSLPRGTGEKLLLRQAARLLGLTSSSELPKRAIQFGSRIAKLESAGEKGFEACSRLRF